MGQSYCCHCDRQVPGKEHHVDDRNYDDKKCNKHEHNNPCSCHHNKHQHCNSHKKDTCTHDHSCKKDFSVRLGGLTNGLTFRLAQLIGSTVVMHIDNGNGSEKILAEICHVGYNYVEVKVIKKISDVLGDSTAEEDMYYTELEKELEVLLAEAKMIESEIDEIHTELGLTKKDDVEKKGYEKGCQKEKKAYKKKRKAKKKHTCNYAIYPLESINSVEYEACDKQHDNHCC